MYITVNILEHLVTMSIKVYTYLEHNIGRDRLINKL